MTKQSVSVRVDEETKKEAEELFEELGLNMSTAVNIFLKQTIREQRIPFVINNQVPNEETIKAIEEGHILLEDSSAQRYSSIEELKNELNSI